MRERARCSGGCVSRMKSSAKRTNQRVGAKMASAPHRGDKQAKPSPLNFASRRFLRQFIASPPKAFSS
jgi:hypothetical protein